MKLADVAFESQRNKSSNLLEAKSILDTLSLPFWLSNGTLLGYYREGSFIEHDPDIDVGVWRDDWTADIAPSFQDAGFRLYREYGSLDAEYQYSFYKRDIKFDIFFYVEEDDHSWQPIFERGRIPHRYIFPRFTLSPVEFLGTTFLVPTDIEAMLVAQYGEDWRIPITEWDCITSPRNVQ